MPYITTLSIPSAVMLDEDAVPTSYLNIVKPATNACNGRSVQMTVFAQSPTLKTKSQHHHHYTLSCTVHKHWIHNRELHIHQCYDLETLPFNLIGRGVAYRIAGFISGYKYSLI